MFDVEGAARALPNRHRERLAEIARAEKALPWAPVDDELHEHKLVGKMADPLGAPLASISRDGWSVLRLIMGKSRI